MAEAMQLILENGFDGMRPAMSLLFNVAMEAERTHALGLEVPFERTDGRKGYANGFKPKTVNTRLGSLDLRIPQVRGGVSFYPSALERGQRSEKAVKLAMAEAYIQGVSTAKVSKLFETLCGFEVSSTQVSDAAGKLDKELECWRSRPLGRCQYLLLDARYEHVRVDGVVRSCALLTAIEIDLLGHRSLAGASVSLSEAEVHWRSFLDTLKKRGLHGMSMITADEHQGIAAALKAVFPGVPVQRCQVHLQRNAAGYVPRLEMRKEVAKDIRDIFRASSLAEAERLLGLAVSKYEKCASRLAAWMEASLPDGFTVFAMPEAHRRRVATTNLSEAINRLVKKRTRVVGVFPSDTSLLRLASGVLAEIDDQWTTEKAYLSRALD
jgi:transposase-like protein